jgi:hypothetical protein
MNLFEEKFTSSVIGNIKSTADTGWGTQARSSSLNPMISTNS